MTMFLYWNQVKAMTLASIKSRYRKTWAGFLWVILNPVIQFGVQSLVFKKFLRLDIPDYSLFLLGGLLPWIFFTSTLVMGTPTFVTQSGLLRSFKINPMVIILSQILDNFINFLMTLLLIMVPFYLVSDRSLVNLFLTPFAIIPLLLGVTSLTIAFSILNVFYRDINFITGFIMNLVFFLTPIFYPRNYVPENLQWMVDINPIVHFIQPFRDLIYSEVKIQDFFIHVGMSFGIALVFTLIAVLVWKRKQNDFYRKL